MTLVEALKNINYDSSWGIWAELNDDGLFDPNSEARYGQRCFENGGMLDAKVYVCNGEWPLDRYIEWCRGEVTDQEWDEEFINWMIGLLNYNRQIDLEYEMHVDNFWF